MMNDLDIKNKRILLFDFDGTLIETASGNTFATDLTDMRIKMDVVNKALDLMQENGVKMNVGLFTFLTCLSEPILKRFSRNGLMKERA